MPFAATASNGSQQMQDGWIKDQSRRAGRLGGGPAVYSRSFNLAVFRHGKGKLIVSTFPLSASSPAGATILANAMR